MTKSWSLASLNPFSKGETSGSSQRSRPHRQRPIYSPEITREIHDLVLNETASLHKTVKVQEREIKALRNENESFCKERKTQLESEALSKANHTKTLSELATLRGTCGSLQEQVQILKRKLSRTKAQNENSNKLLEQRTAELEAAQSFLPMRNSISESELQKQVELLNDEIMDRAAAISDSLSTAERVLVEDAEAERWIKDLSRWPFLDHSLTGMLRSQDMKQYHVEVALRAALVCAAYYAITTIDPKRPSDVLQLSDGIVRAECYPTAAKWRAVTHAQLRRTIDFKEHHSLIFETAVKMVLTVAGWSGMAKELDIPSNLDRLINAAIELNDVVLQRIFTVQVHLRVFSPSTIYDPVIMEDESAGSPDVKTDDQLHVLCTTSLGLAFSPVNLQAPGRPHARPETALKANVITQGMFEPPSTSRRD